MADIGLLAFSLFFMGSPSLRTITAYVVFQDWPHLLQSIADAAIRPP
jgi:hypothetical protein